MEAKYGSLWFSEANEDIEAGRGCLERACQADFWDSHGGFRLFFWRWPPNVQEWARDGNAIYLS
jgi:hypothetical protein